jgi:hypothetical protein
MKNIDPGGRQGARENKRENHKVNDGTTPIYKRQAL